MSAEALQFAKARPHCTLGANVVGGGHGTTCFVKHSTSGKMFSRGANNLPFHNAPWHSGHIEVQTPLET